MIAVVITMIGDGDMDSFLVAAVVCLSCQESAIIGFGKSLSVMWY